MTAAKKKVESPTVTIIRKLPKNWKPASGSHTSVEQGMCIMEAAAYLVNGWTDRPECVSPVIGAFCRNWNDNMNNADREQLTPYAEKVLGTNTGPEDEITRAWLATDWLVRVHTPAWLRLAGLTNEAQALEGLARIVDTVTCQAAQPALNAARKQSAAAWDAARAAARAAAWAAARDAAWAAAWDAARAAARDAAWAAARDAAWAAARDAAWTAARAAAWAAARDAASKSLRSTVVLLQASALDLLDRMIAVRRLDVVVKLPRPGLK